MCVHFNSFSCWVYPCTMYPTKYHQDMSWHDKIVVVHLVSARQTPSLSIRASICGISQFQQDTTEISTDINPSSTQGSCSVRWKIVFCQSWSYLAPTGTLRTATSQPSTTCRWRHFNQNEHWFVGNSFIFVVTSFSVWPLLQ